MKRWWIGVLLLAGCGGDELPPAPSQEVAAAYFAQQPRVEVRVQRRVVELRITQSGAQLRRGGALWARVGPFVYLFSEPTQDLLTENPGIRAVEAVTLTEDGREVARATLRAGELNEILWRRALNIQAKARRDGTQRPTLLEDLVQWGEEHTEFAYNPDFTG